MLMTDANPYRFTGDEDDDLFEGSDGEPRRPGVESKIITGRNLEEISSQLPPEVATELRKLFSEGTGPGGARITAPVALRSSLDLLEFLDTLDASNPQGPALRAVAEHQRTPEVDLEDLVVFFETERLILTS